MDMNLPNQTPTDVGDPSLPNEEGDNPKADEPSEQPPPKKKSRRGFAAMDPKLVSEIASKGGKAAHAAGTAHEFTSEEARAAGRKGGLAPHTKRKTKEPPAPPPASAQGGNQP
jgi:general stress protein YciG